MMLNIYINHYNAGNGVKEEQYIGVDSWGIDKDTNLLVINHNNFTTEYVAMEQVLGIKVIDMNPKGEI